MGGFYSSVHVKTDDRTLVQQALDKLSSDTGAKFLVAPVIDGWVGVFPSGEGMELGLGASLSDLITEPIFHCMVHDDDVFTYEFYSNKEQLDAYNSCPDYFGGEAGERGGTLNGFEAVLPDQAKREELKKLLVADRFPFEYERLEKFANLLRIPNALTSYEYLQNGERDGIQQWKQFVHIPDLTAKRAAAKAVKAQIKAEWKRLLKEGPLIVDQEGRKVGSRDFFASPIWCIDPVHNDVLLAWSGNPIGDSIPTPVERVDPHTGARTPTRLGIPDKVNCMAVSPNGQSLAVGCARGHWKAQVWDIEGGHLVIEIDQKRFVDSVCFGIDGRRLYTLSESVITEAALDDSNCLEYIEVPNYAKVMAMHPSGTHLALECAGMISVVDLALRRVTKTIWIPEPPGPRREMLEQFVSQPTDEMLPPISPYLPPSEVERLRAPRTRQPHLRQSVFSFNFGKSGAYMFCGTSAGVAVLEWAKVLETPDGDSLDPVGFVKAERLEGDDQGFLAQLIYSVPMDVVARRILFAGLEGKVRFANLVDNKVGDLLVPPTRMPFWKLELTPDRSALVGTAIPPVSESLKRGAPHFQVWNYRALCDSAGLTW